jgi:hypothetical protein
MAKLMNIFVVCEDGSLRIAPYGVALSHPALLGGAMPSIEERM